MSMEHDISPGLSEILAPSEFQCVAGGYQILAMQTNADIRHHNLLLLISTMGSVQAMATAIDRSHSQVSQLKNRSKHSKTGEPRLIGDDVARLIEEKLGMPTGWMDAKHEFIDDAWQNPNDPTGPKITPPKGPGFRMYGEAVKFAEAFAAAAAATESRGVAQQVSLKAAKVDRIHPLAWEAIMSVGSKEDLPDLFTVSMQDDSMAPRVRQGAVLHFSKNETARPGDGVLVRDKAGELYFRIHRQRRPGVWEAHADNSDYQALESERDGLEILAVLTAIEGRWG